MATTKPRITVTVEPDVYGTLKRLSTLNSTPMSKIVSEMLDVMAVPLERVVSAHERLRTADEQVKQGIRDSADLAILELERVNNKFQEDLFTALGLDENQKQ